jgi:hypothetical protein
MSITLRELQAAEAQRRQVQANIDAIGQALDSWNHSLRDQLADIGRVHTITDVIGQALDARAKMTGDVIARALDARAKIIGDAIGQALNAWNRQLDSQLATITRVQLPIDTIGQALNAHMERFDAILRDASAAMREDDPPVPTGGAVIASRNMDGRLMAQLALRVFTAMIALALVTAIWEEGKDTAPAAAAAMIIGVLQAWNQVDKAIWKW